MSDIEHELGAELIRRSREGTLVNGDGGRLLAAALKQLESEQQLRTLRRDLDVLRCAARGPGAPDLLRRVRDTAAKYKTVTEFCDGAGI